MGSNLNKPADFDKQLQAVGTLTQLSSAFESLASLQIARVKDQVVQSQAFFDELWRMYTQIRVDRLFHFGRRMSQKNISPKELVVVITAEGGLSGDIDERLIRYMLKNHDPVRQDIIVVGHHGAVQLAQAGVSYKRYFKLPSKDQNINVAPIIQEVQGYSLTRVYYQSYVSLMVQDVKSISLSTMVEEKGRGVTLGEEVISEENYIFEPSVHAVIDHLERSMLQISLTQVILYSKLAQYASRFRAMSEAHTRAEQEMNELHRQRARAKRHLGDKRLREITSGLRRSPKGAWQ